MYIPPGAAKNDAKRLGFRVSLPNTVLHVRALRALWEDTAALYKFYGWPMSTSILPTYDAKAKRMRAAKMQPDSVTARLRVLLEKHLDVHPDEVH